MSSDDFVEYPVKEAHHLSNVNCIYCGKMLDEVESTKEHVVGRKFVPKGTLDGQWNLIANACQKCNGLKAALENDISAITMQPDVAGRHVNSDEILKEEAARKGKGSYSQITGKAVKDSYPKINFVMQHPGFEIKFGLTASPQVAFERIAQLAYYHVTGFFFMQTYKQQTNRGGFRLGTFCPIIEADRADWGNEVMMWFMQETKNWDIRLHAVTAQEYFKIAFRKTENDLMAWAVEWNQKKRCIGFWGNEQDLAVILKRRPVLPRQHIGGDIQNSLFSRIEKPLASSQDALFAYP